MMGSNCPAVEQYGDHLYETIYTRPWYCWFRKVYWLVCWRCDLMLGPVDKALA